VPEGFCFLIAKLSVDIRRKIERDSFLCLVLRIKCKMDMLIGTNVETNCKGCIVCFCDIVSASEAENTVAFNLERLEKLTVYAKD
jgi:hypothetical protein